MSEEPVRIARIGLALELEDGTMVKLYTDQCSGATADIDHDTDTEIYAYRGQVIRTITGHQTTITLAGLNYYDMQITYPERPELEGQPALEAAAPPVLRDVSLTKAGDGMGTIALEEAPDE